MKRVLSILVVLSLAACGVDGEPTRPNPKPERPSTGVTVSGTARIGVSVSRGATGLWATGLSQPAGNSAGPGR